MSNLTQLPPTELRRARRALHCCQRTEDAIASGSTTRAALVSVSRATRVPHGTLRSWFYRWKASGRLIESLIDGRRAGPHRHSHRWTPTPAQHHAFLAAILDPRHASLRSVFVAVFPESKLSAKTMRRWAASLLTPSQLAALRRLWRLLAIERGIKRRLAEQLKVEVPKRDFHVVEVAA